MPNKTRIAPGAAPAREGAAPGSDLHPALAALVRLLARQVVRELLEVAAEAATDRSRGDTR